MTSVQQRQTLQHKTLKQSVSAAPNPLLALLGDDDDDDDEISAFGRAGVVNLDDTRVRAHFRFCCWLAF